MNDILTAHTGETFFFKKGITDKQIDQLIEYARTDETVKNFTSDANRFASRDTFNAWRKPDAVFYTLTDENDNLMGIIWFEELALPEFIPGTQPTTYNLQPTNFHTTFAIRTYGNARGKGLAVPFTQKALEGLKLENRNSGIWLATSPDNLPAVTSYKQTGFVELGMKKDGEKVIMILP